MDWDDMAGLYYLTFTLLAAMYSTHATSVTNLMSSVSRKNKYLFMIRKYDCDASMA
jgi:hypothetical protein